MIGRENFGLNSHFFSLLIELRVFKTYWIGEIGSFPSIFLSIPPLKGCSAVPFDRFLGMVPICKIPHREKPETPHGTTVRT
jgi:hypothetical protein